MKIMKDIFKNKKLLITGGTGSFGNAVLEKFIHSNVKEITIFSRDEKKQDDLRRKHNSSKIKFYIGDIRDKESLISVTRGIDFIFHAAALKQVPSCEFFPMEAVKTNVIGTENLLEAAILNNVKKVIALSTDKAAAPINLYGASKLCSDKLFLAANNIKGNRDLTFATVRYGNVMGSRGSVIPFFLKQSKSGKITITNKNMTRFNITLDEGVKFVHFALENSMGGELYVPKLKSYRIMVIVSAIAPDCDYEFCGIRPGEKIDEEMITISDSRNTLDCGTFYVHIPNENLFRKYKTLNPNFKQVPENFNYTSGNNNEFLTVEEIRDLIKKNIDSNFKPL